MVQGKSGKTFYEESLCKANGEEAYFIIRVIENEMLQGGSDAIFKILKRRRRQV